MKANENSENEITMLRGTVNALLEHIELLKKENHNLKTQVSSSGSKTSLSNTAGAAPVVITSTGGAIKDIPAAQTPADTTQSEELKTAGLIGVAAQQALLMSDENYSWLRAGLNGSFGHQIKLNTIKCLARELILLYNKGTATSKELSAVADLSQAGFEKHLTMIKRRKFIQKHGVGKYSLTPGSLLLINGVMERLRMEDKLPG